MYFPKLLSWILILVMGWSVLAVPKMAFGQETTPVEDALKKEIDELKNKISDLQGQEKTLTNQIKVMDSQMKLTEVKIEATKQQIQLLATEIEKTKTKIDQLDVSLTSMATLLIKRIAATYEAQKFPTCNF